MKNGRSLLLVSVLFIAPGLYQAHADTTSADTTHNLASETLNGSAGAIASAAQFTNTDFTITGNSGNSVTTVERFTASPGAGVTSTDSSNTASASTITVAANGTTISSFQLTAITFEIAVNADTFDVTVTGYSGATLVATSTTTNTNGGTVGNPYTVNLTTGPSTFSSKQLTSFVVTFTPTGSQHPPYDFTLKSFTAASSVAADTTPPTISSINRVGATPTNAVSVDYTVTFSENVTGVDTSDFALTATGTAAGTIASVTGSGSS